MAKFVECTARGGKKIWLNPDCCVSLMDTLIDGEQCVCVIGADGEIPYYVMGTVPEVRAKLQGDLDPEPAKAADDIKGWYTCPTGEVCWVIGRTTHDMFAYQFAGRRHIYTLEFKYLQDWTRDPNRTSW